MTAEEIWGAIAVWAVLCAVVALIANARGRSQLNWFLISFLLSPVVGFVAVVLMPNLKTRTAELAPTPGVAPPCPRCGQQRIPGQRYCPGCALDLWADYDQRQ